MRISFSIDTQGSAENRSWVMEFLKNVFTGFKHHEKLDSVESLCKEESDRLASLHSFCTEYKDRSSQLSYWLNSCCHGNRGGICLDCLPEDSSAICWSTLLPQVLYPIGRLSVTLSVSNVEIWKLILFYEPRHFHITHEIRNEYCYYFVSTLILWKNAADRLWSKTRKAENINRWKKCEACGRCSWRKSSCNMWRTF